VHVQTLDIYQHKLTSKNSFCI